MAALRKVRITEAGLEEYEIHDLLSGALLSAGIFHSRERSFAPRCRADLWVDGIVIEVKKMRPPRAALFDQVTRYASQECVRAVIVVLERSISLPATICGKPVSVLSLNALWGIAV
ncbi:hypothetical protein HBO23_31945 [Pseudomonas sp. WS 5532]|nr:hypothetical protein [Pseudomonas sp. WS 5532]